VNWLKDRIRAWLDVPHETLPSEAQRLPRKASGALYAEIRAARAEVSRLLEEVRGARLGIRGQEAALLRASADYSNTLSEVADLQRKLDAAFDALGYVVVANDEGPASVVPIEPRALRSARVLAARSVARELDLILLRAKSTEDSLNAKVQRMRAMRDEVTTPSNW
jgi:hypothetical protein